MAIIDAILVFSPTSSRPTPYSWPPCPRRATPAPVGAWGPALMGYGDLFVAGVFGAIIAADGRAGVAVGQLVT